MEKDDNVLDLGEFKLKKVNKYYEPTQCKHKNLIADQKAHAVTCEDCGLQVSSFFALMKYSENVKKHMDHLKRERDKINELQKQTVTLKAALELQKAWRKRKMVPACPHCGRGILAEDRLGGSTTSKEYEMARRKNDNNPLIYKPKK